MATGENLHTLYEFKEMIASGGVTFPEADVTNCGGVTAFIKIAHMAEAFNLPITLPRKLGLRFGPKASTSLRKSSELRRRP